MVGLELSPMSLSMRRGFPTDFPMVGLLDNTPRTDHGRGFPTDFPMVGYAFSSSLIILLFLTFADANITGAPFVGSQLFHFSFALQPAASCVRIGVR